MMTIVLYILAGLFCLKIVWNILVPFMLARMLIQSTTGRTSGITLMPFVEIGLFLLVVLASALSDGSTWLHSPKQVALWGFVAILGSYMVFAVLGIVLGWCVAQFKKRWGNPSTERDLNK